MAEAFIGEIRAVAFDYAPEGWLPCDGRVLQISQYETLYTLLGSNFGGDGRTTFSLPDLRGKDAVGAFHGAYASGTIYGLGKFGGVETNALRSNQVPIPPHTHTTDYVDPVFRASITDTVYDTAITDPVFTASSTDPVYAASMVDPDYHVSVSATVKPKAKIGMGGAASSSPENNVCQSTGANNNYNNTPNTKMAPADVTISAEIIKTNPGSVTINKTAQGTVNLVKQNKGSVTICKKTTGSVTLAVEKAGSVALQPNQFSSAQLPIDNRQPYLVINYIICVMGIYPGRPL